MSWKRGTESVDRELLRIQIWIEGVDPILNGDNGEPGMIRNYYDDKAAERQRGKDIAILVKLAQWVVAPASVGALLLQLARAAHLIQ
jgi:hypothetical protein